MVEVRAENITKIFKTTKALDNVSITVDDGLFFSLLGPSGSGKTTLMRIIAGLETPTTGSVYFADTEVTDLSPSARNIAMVFQFPSIYPSLNVYHNIALAIRREVKSKQEEMERVKWVAELLRIDAHLYKKHNQIDFGILQRVSIAKAIVRKANVYIFDEPLSNLDTRLREELRSEFQRIHNEVGGTFLYVTHDQIEAMGVADKIGVLHNGVLQQVGTPDEIFNYPANKFVAYFIGSPTMNFIETNVKLVENSLYASVGETFIELDRRTTQLWPIIMNRRLLLGVRPHDIMLSVAPVENSVPAKVVFTESLGTSMLVELQSGSANFKSLVENDYSMKEGMTVYATFNKQNIHLIDAENERVYTSQLRP